MRTALLLVCLLSTWQGAAPRTSSSTDDEAAVKAVVKSYLDARVKRDAQALGALFVDDADQLVSSGEWRRGRDELVKGTLASSDRTAGTRTIAIQTIRFPAPGVALADGPYEIEGSQARRMWTAFILVKQAGAWKIAAIRNMLPSAPAPPPAK